MVTAQRTLNDYQLALFKALDFEATQYQLPILADGRSELLICGGERAGKSAVLVKLLESRKKWGTKERFALLAADYNRTNVEWEYLVNDLTKLDVIDGKVVEPSVGPRHLTLIDGTVIETKSANDPRTLAMYSYDGIIICEASQVSHEIYERALGRVASQHGFVCMSGTLEGSLGWYPSLFEAWQWGDSEHKSYSLPTWSNPHLFPGGRDDPAIIKLKSNTSDTYFMERIEGKPCPPVGVVIPEFRADLHIRPVEYNPALPVYFSIDPGYGHPYAVEVIQKVGDQVWVVDEIYERGLVTEEIIDIAMKRVWWQNPDKQGVIDVAGLQHQAMAAPTEVWFQKTGVYLRNQRVRINEGTERLKGLLKPHPITGKPFIIINPKCIGLISELGGCPDPFDGETRVYSWKTDREGNIVGETPDDRYNDGIKALIYWLVDQMGYVTSNLRSTIKIVRH